MEGSRGLELKELDVPNLADIKGSSVLQIVSKF